MPLSAKKLSKNRAEFRDSLSPAEVELLVRDNALEILQTSTNVLPETWTLLNEKFIPARPDVWLRVYGHTYEFDLSFLPLLQNLRRFSADCLGSVTGIEYLESLNHLVCLGVGVYGLTSFDFLALLPVTLRELTLGDTKSNTLSLRQIERFSDLTTLTIVRQHRDIEVISNLRHLERLRLNSISVKGLRFLQELKRLWSLEIRLGGTNNLSSLAEMDGLKHLELWQIRGLKDISMISMMRGLQFLALHFLSHITSLPDLSRLVALRRLLLEVIRGLIDLRAISKAPRLQEFVHYSAKGMEPAQYAELLQSRILTEASVWFGSNKKNKLFEDMASIAGVKPYSRTEFVFTT